MDGSANKISSRITPLQTLDRCKSLCKNTKNMYGFLLQSSSSLLEDNNNRGGGGGGQKKAFVGNNLMLEDTDTYKDTDYQNNVEIVASSMKGILCCIKGNKFYKSSRKLYVCKPTTGQWQQIPWPKSSLSAMRVGLIILSIKPLRYKIIWMSSNFWNDSKFQCEVFDSSTWKWKEKEELFLPSSTLRLFLYEHEQGVQAGRILYFLMDTHILAIQGQGDKEEDEITFKIPFPYGQSISKMDVGIWTRRCHKSPDYYLVRKKLIEYQGKLGLIRMTPRISSMQLWSLLETEDSQMWMKIKEVDLRFVGETLYAYPVGFYRDAADILVLEETKNIGQPSLILCNIQDSTCIEINLDGFHCPPNTFPFRSDREMIVDLTRGGGSCCGKFLCLILVLVLLLLLICLV